MFAGIQNIVCLWFICGALLAYASASFSETPSAPDQLSSVRGAIERCKLTSTMPFLLVESRDLNGRHTYLLDRTTEALSYCDGVLDDQSAIPYESRSTGRMTHQYGAVVACVEDIDRNIRLELPQVLLLSKLADNDSAHYVQLDQETLDYCGDKLKLTHSKISMDGKDTDDELNQVDGLVVGCMLSEESPFISITARGSTGAYLSYAVRETESARALCGDKLVDLATPLRLARRRLVETSRSGGRVPHVPLMSGESTSPDQDDGTRHELPVVGDEVVGLGTVVTCEHDPAAADRLIVVEMWTDSSLGTKTWRYPAFISDAVHRKWLESYVSPKRCKEIVASLTKPPTSPPNGGGQQPASDTTNYLACVRRSGGVRFIGTRSNMPVSLSQDVTNSCAVCVSLRYDFTRNGETMSPIASPGVNMAPGSLQTLSYPNSAIEGVFDFRILRAEKC